MYIIDIDRVQVGDILLTARNHPGSKAIRFATKGDYSHAMLCVDHASYIHSDANGVHAGNLQRLLFESNSHVKVIRVRTDISRELIKEACIFARSQIGKSYSTKEAIKSVIGGVYNDKTNRQFCSRLVAQAYDHAGIILVGDPLYCTPQELDDSPHTEEVSGCVRKASDAEVEFANSYNPLERQSEITNSILESARKITGKDIQTLEQLIIHVIKNPEHDRPLTDVVARSGYLTMWKFDIGQNPWRYNIGIFSSLPVQRDELIGLAAAEYDGAIQVKERFETALSQLESVQNISPREYVAQEIALYRILIATNEKRIETAMSFLKSHINEAKEGL